MLWRAARRLVSDVIAWTTVHESQKNYLVRERRVKIAQSLLNDVLSDDACERCVLVGHSLGSSIILEAFRRQNNLCRAVNIGAKEREEMVASIRKVSHIFTIGSPIEKIASLFQVDSTQSHRYHKLKHANPHRLESPAWSEKGGPRLINMWSRYDPVSSAIVSFDAAPHVKWRGVENVQVAPSGIPHPLKAHSGYFRDMKAMGVIYQAIASGKISDERLSVAQFRNHLPVWRAVFPFSLAVLGFCSFSVWWQGGFSSNNWLLITLSFLCVSGFTSFRALRANYLLNRPVDRSKNKAS